MSVQGLPISTITIVIRAPGFGLWLSGFKSWFRVSGRGVRVTGLENHGEVGVHRDGAQARDVPRRRLPSHSGFREPARERAHERKRERSIDKKM